MRLIERVARASDRFYDRMRSANAQEAAEVAPTGSLADLQGRKYCVLVTYKKSGAPVPSPLWFGTGNGRLYFHTGASHAKVRRIERNPQVRVAAATARGRPLAAPFVGTARVLPKDEGVEAERCLAANYGLGRRLYMRLVQQLDGAYVEVMPTPLDDGSADKPE
jgi:PPOX class probable F420-dependent enzyme